MGSQVPDLEWEPWLGLRALGTGRGQREKEWSALRWALELVRAQVVADHLALARRPAPE